MSKYEPVIGLEIHVQLKTQSKLFCSCDNTGETKPPNTTICPICVGHPGVLPLPNDQAVRAALTVALALGCHTPKTTYFDRKSYFYPDLPKGFQISQHGAAFGTDGHLLVHTKVGKRRVRIERVHLEDDSGKLLHESDKSASYVDYNRAGTPLVEIVTQPDLQSPTEARTFLQELRLVMRYLGVSDADMEKGHLRCDANVSLRPNPEYFLEREGQAGIGLDPHQLYPKTEIKNLNSFKAVEHSLAYELERQAKLWDAGAAPTVQSTRGWDEKRGVTIEQRIKEAQHDYRYFPEPDLPPIEFPPERIAYVQQSVAELPYAKRERFQEQYGLPAYDAGILVADKKLGDYYEHVMSELRAWLIALGDTEGTEEEIWQKDKTKLSKLAANWLVNRLSSFLNERKISIDAARITPENFAELLTLIFKKRLNNQTALLVLSKMFLTGRDPSDIIEEESLSKISGADDLGQIVDNVLHDHEAVATQYRAGKKVALQFLIGQVLKRVKGRADIGQVRDLLVHKLK